MDKKILNFYLQFSQYTYPGAYQEILQKFLPSSVKDIGLLVRQSLIHRMTMQNGNTGSNRDLRYGDMTKIPWYRQSEDDVFITAAAMLAELYRRDNRGLVLHRSAENKLVLTCRFVSVLMASLLKIKGIPVRVRPGFAPYFHVEGLPSGKSDDHWVNQYWSEKESRWVTIDVDGSLEDYIKLDLYDIPVDKFDFSANAWFKVRRGEVEGEHFYNAAGYTGLMVIAWELFYDFHCLMNNEIVYNHHPEMVQLKNFDKNNEEQLKKIDELAELMVKPDDNFATLQHIWQTKREFRLLKGGLL